MSDAAPLKEAPERADAHAHASFGESGLKLGKRHVRLLVDQRQDQRGIGLNAS